MRKIAITDIHGCAQTFIGLLEQIQFSKADHLFLLGDYVDRGPDSKGVLDHIFLLKAHGYQLSCLKGNHEERMERARIDDNTYKLWYESGGRETLDSFGVTNLEEIPSKYWAFFEDLSIYFEEDEYILVHAGLNFKSENPMNDLVAMVWIRDWYGHINYEWIGDRIIVHGHIQQTHDEINYALAHLPFRKIMGIDNGCSNLSTEGRGQLCAFDMTNQLCYFRKNEEMAIPEVNKNIPPTGV